MAVNLVSPGVKVREVDLTLGRIDQANDQIAAFAGPFQKGPVNIPILIQSERELINTFGKPRPENNQSSYWLHASNYLSYGGIMQVVRTNSSAVNAMENANVSASGISTVKILSIEDYNNKSDDSDNSLSNFWYAAKNPGSWANDYDIYAIDSAADQIITGIGTTAVVTSTTVFNAVVNNRQGNIVGGATSITGIATEGISTGTFIVCDTSGVISPNTTVTSIGTNEINISIAATTNFVSGVFSFDFGTFSNSTITTGITVLPGYGVSVTVVDRAFSGIGVTSKFNGHLKGIITGVGQSSIDVKLISKHDTTNGSFEFIEYIENNPLYSIQQGDALKIVNPSTSNFISTYTEYTVKDWYNTQTINIGNSTLYWKNIADRPSTSEYVRESGGKNDEINLIIVDTKGKVNGNVGEIIEKFAKLSKASDGKIGPAQFIYYKDYIRDNSNYLFVGAHEVGKTTRFSSINNYSEYSSGQWGQVASNTFFNVIGNKKYTLSRGTDYTSDLNSYGINLEDIISAYSAFENAEQYPINYIINGPSDGASIFEAQSKANYVISIAETRKDCIAVVSTYEKDIINKTNSITNSTDQTQKIVNFFNGVTSSSYAVFDSGYKYTYDRYNNRFTYLACNSDVAGLMARSSINQFPWVSPAGASRGVLNNAIKLAYNPTEAQRDILYTNRINPIIAAPGQGIILYGDKTASASVSAFDRINVRRLFLTIKRTIERAARSQLFEFNDAITRNSFINIVDPYLSDIRSKRGITDYLVVCDETNNTPDIIDSNQFRADIFIQPARVINFINLTFVATRTGVSFSEVVGNI